MKTQRFRATEHSTLEEVLEEVQQLGYDAEIDGDEVVVYLNPRQRKSKRKPQQTGKAEKWSKRERNFGYTRGN
jgi:hypothetical protein